MFLVVFDVHLSAGQAQKSISVSNCPELQEGVCDRFYWTVYFIQVFFHREFVEHILQELLYHFLFRRHVDESCGCGWSWSLVVSWVVRS